ncbi:hypothetical protein D915_003611 [Fasciola hepatica]|uniref:Leucine Rich repeat-containing domain protein n=1 Tax=Fasciola hepatica TaxID=6192 RepID=A0A4E0RUM4_FASHE|nr:hypothetical protein D915_003611 [Fasciola hepatica]
MNLQTKWMLASVVIFCFSCAVESYYDVARRYYSIFYYTLSKTCEIPRTLRYVTIYSAGLDPLVPDLRVLSIESRPGPANFMFRIEKTFEDLEVYIVTGHVHLIKLTAPNLRAFTIVDTMQISWDDNTWNFPKLRAINILTGQIIRDTVIEAPSFGAKELYALRLHRMERSAISFVYSEAFAKLKILELSAVGFVSATGLCEFLPNLKELRSLLLAGVYVPCVLDAIQELRKYGNLKSVRLFKHDIPIMKGTLCYTFPPDIEHLHLSIDKGPSDLSELTCFAKLKTLVLSYPPDEVTIIETNAPTVLLQASVTMGDSSVFDSIKLSGTRALTFDQMTGESTSIPPMPLAETIRFTGNGFRFEPGVDPFPDHRNVRLLDLSDNPIGTIPNDAFKALPKLGVLILQKTEIKYFGETAFCNLQWPRAINFGNQLPKQTSTTRLPQFPGQQWSTLRCLMTQKRESNILYESDVCNCREIQYHYMNREVRIRAYTQEGIVCSNYEDFNLFAFYEKKCMRWTAATYKKPLRMIRLNYTEQIPMCENKMLEWIWFFLWIAYILFCWIPPIILFILHRRAFRKQLMHDQLTSRPRNLFIICPRHARQWCKKVIVPCLEADLFTNKAPKLRPLRTERSEKDRTKQNIAEQDSKNGQNIYSSDSENKGMNSSSLSKQRGCMNSFSQHTVSSASTGINAPQGPWAWQPRFHCHVAPPARHRLGIMMESCQVVIIFPSASLFTEPACRAQIRLAFHLTRLNRIPPPAIIVWPVTRTLSSVPKNYHLVNRSKKRLDENKYYTTPRFDSVRNDPEDPAETAIIKAKMPTREEAIEILQYFATLTGPCVHWSNLKTVCENLKPLVWWMNKASQIPAY